MSHPEISVARTSAMIAPAGRETSRLRSLDAIRGIAALLVVVGHSAEQALRFLSPAGAVGGVLRAALIDYLNLGRVGVVAFFLVSGYVIPFSFSHHRPVRSFAIARFFRLYPAYWASIALAVIVGIIITGSAPPARQIVANVTMVQALLGQNDIIGVYWTLFYELLFYALSLLAFVAGRMESPRYLLTVVCTLSCLGFAAAVWRYAGHGGVPIGIPMFLAIMHLGTLARLSDRGDGAEATNAFRAGLVVVLLTAGPISGIGFIQHATNQRLIADVTSVYAGMALFFMLRSRAAIVMPATVFLGLISYSLYLFHPLCLDLVVALTDLIEPDVRVIVILCAVPVSAVLLSALVQRYVEAPANRLGKRFRDA